MNAELRVIGCRAGSPGDGSPASGYLLKTDAATLLIDCGPGVVQELGRMGWIDQIDGVIISHRHADHCADLVALAYHRLFPHKQPALPLFGPPDLAETLSALDGIFGIPSLPTMARPVSDSFPFTALEPGESFTACGITIQTMAAQHPVPTLAMRFPQLGLVYTADGARTDALTRFAQGASLLVADSTYVESNLKNLEAHGHMTATGAGYLAHNANVQRLVLTHFADMHSREQAMLEARTQTQAVVEAALPGMHWALTG
jgi:ribonuclease BN (tRNA processing enzyme)